MKIRPVILCGGAGTRLWPNFNNHQAKQFIDFGNWTLLDKTLERTKASIYDAPIISTNKKYLKAVIDYNGPIAAPIKKNDILGTLKVFYKDELINEYQVLAFEDVKKVNIFSRLIKSVNYLIWGDV